jgi:hypothetical protein
MAIFDTPKLLEALQHVDKGNYSAAFEVLAHLADAGNPKAQCNLATLYHLGLGVTAEGRKAGRQSNSIARLPNRIFMKSDCQRCRITTCRLSISAAPLVSALIENEPQNIQP